MKKFEIKAFHESTTYDKVWLEVYAEDLEDAKKQIEEGNYQWLDSKNLDNFDGKFTNEEDWEIVDEEEVKDDI